jgi:hypothetical protein
MMRFHGWINSSEGQAWYAKNAQAISFFEYITPMSELNSVFEALVPGQNHALGNFGQLGGLPFGWIPQLLDSEGITHFSPPAVNSNDGAIYGNYIPTTSRGQVAVAIQDLLGNMFTWPGASLGLPSKGKATAEVAFGLLGGSRTKDAQYVTPPESSLSPQEQTYQQTIQQLAGTAPGGGQAPQGGAPGQTPPIGDISVPAQHSPVETPPRTSSNSGSGGHLKKSQFKPALLPGQSELGQLP